jgi:hypothetical protein
MPPPRHDFQLLTRNVHPRRRGAATDALFRCRRKVGRPRACRIRIAVVAPPARSGGQIDLEQDVDDADGVAYARITRGAEPEANQSESMGAYEQRCRPPAVLRWTILDRHEPVER